MLYPLRKVTGHIPTEIEMKLYFINVLLATVAVIDWATSAMMQLVTPCCQTLTVMDSVCVTEKVLISLLIFIKLLYSKQVCCVESVEMVWELVHCSIDV